ncbi:MAG: cyclic nucleotide-binding domain-containing protein [Chloroflexi bacterium]|nr:cyclic nucleotide-binding domain-containing protein [Chloroflexota bacterium]
MGRTTVKEVLRNCTVFAPLTDSELDKVVNSLLILEKQYDPGTTIFKGGNSAEELLVVVEGKIALQEMLPNSQGQSNRRVTVDVITPGEVVGWSAIVQPYIYNFSAVCLQKVKVLSFSATKLRWLLENNREIGYKLLNGLIKVVASRLDDTRHVLVSERFLTLKQEQ